MKIKCNCICHQPGVQVYHMVPCCDNGYIAKEVSLSEIYDVKLPVIGKIEDDNVPKINEGLWKQLEKPFEIKEGLQGIDSWMLVDAIIYVSGSYDMPYSEPCKNMDDVTAALKNLQIINKYNLM